jgi:hypothetical protein
MARQMLNMLTGAAVPELVQRGVEVARVPLAVLLPVAVGM